jgi:hypothetical protein
MNSCSQGTPAGPLVMAGLTSLADFAKGSMLARHESAASFADLMGGMSMVHLGSFQLAY